MYADVEARAGVLEPEGIVEIKMRRDKILSLMNRLDPKYASLKKEFEATKGDKERKALEEREKFLQPTYKQIALLYADLHDRTGRMEAKGCAKPATWKEARRFFYWATRARVARSRLLAELAVASPELSLEERVAIIEDLASIDQTTTNHAAAEALERVDVSAHVTRLKSEQLVRNLLNLSRENHKATISGLARLADNLSDEDRSTLITALQSVTGPPNPPSYS